MKRIPFYRRGGKPGRDIKERVCWRLHAGPATGTQLADMLGITLVEFNRATRNMLKGTATAVINVTEWRPLGSGVLDRTYTLEKVGGPRAVPKGGRSLLINPKTLSYDKVKNTEAAKCRARLIAAGLYINEMG